jgi:predicted RND superfamily exporter protein
MKRELGARGCAWIVSHPGIIIIIAVLITSVCAFSLRRGIEFDASALNFVEDDSREKRDYEAARRDFGEDAYLILSVTVDDLFKPEHLLRLRAFHEELSRIDGIAEILSPFNVPFARSDANGAAIEKLIPAGELSAARIAEARAAATTDRLYVGNLVSADGRTAAWNMLLDSSLPTRARHAVTRRIYELAHGANLGEIYFAGGPFSQWRATEAIKKDLALFLPITVLLIASLLWFAFRSMIAVLLPLLTIGLGLCWLLGAMVTMGAHFTILALMLPTLLLAIGCSYLIHIFNQIGLENDSRKGDGDGRKALASALQFIALPVIVSALTIIAGFLSLSFTKIPAVRVTSIYAALGAALAMVLSLTFTPAVLSLRGLRGLRIATGIGGQLSRVIEWTGMQATRREKLLYLATAVLVVFSLIGVRKIIIDIDYFNLFRPGAETSVGMAEINRRLSGVVNFDLIIENPEPGTFERPEMLARIVALQHEFETNVKGIDRTLSVADFVRHLNRAFHGGDPQYDSIPPDPRALSELLSDRAQLSKFMTADGARVRILVRMRSSASREMASVIGELERRGREMMPEMRVYTTGTLVLMNRTSDIIGREQAQSIVIALLAIFIMLALLFGSLRVGLTALIPNLIPVLFFFGFMGWRGIPLNLTTSLVASVVLGLAVDNAVQFIVRFRRIVTKHSAVRPAIIESLRLSGRPIVYANVALAATFAIFSLSTFAPIGSFGLLSAVTILGCLVEDLVLLPARLTSPVFQTRAQRAAIREQPE